MCPTRFATIMTCLIIQSYHEKRLYALWRRRTGFHSAPEADKSATRSLQGFSGRHRMKTPRKTGQRRRRWPSRRPQPVPTPVASTLKTSEWSPWKRRRHRAEKCAGRPAAARAEMRCNTGSPLGPCSRRCLGWRSRPDPIRPGPAPPGRRPVLPGNLAHAHPAPAHAGLPQPALESLGDTNPPGLLAFAIRPRAGARGAGPSRAGPISGRSMSPRFHYMWPPCPHPVLALALPSTATVTEQVLHTSLGP